METFQNLFMKICFRETELPGFAEGEFKKFISKIMNFSWKWKSKIWSGKEVKSDQLDYKLYSDGHKVLQSKGLFSFHSNKFLISNPDSFSAYFQASCNKNMTLPRNCVNKNDKSKSHHEIFYSALTLILRLCWTFDFPPENYVFFWGGRHIFLR